MGLIKKGMTCLWMFIFMVKGFPAGEYTTIGGNAAAMGLTSVATGDHWSLFNNPAGIGWLTHYSAGTYYENRFLVKELGIKAVGIVLPFRPGTVGVTFLHYGFSLYNEMKTGIVVGRKFGNHFSAGVQIDYLRIHQGDDLGNRNLFTFGIGLQYKVNSHLSLGMHLYNPVPFHISPDEKERMIPLLRLGLSWNPSEQLISNLEISKDDQSTPSFKGGLEYHIVKPLSIRVGLMTNPAIFTFGFGLEFGGLTFDFASSYHPVLGYSPQVSLIYTLKN